MPVSTAAICAKHAVWNGRNGRPGAARSVVECAIAAAFGSGTASEYAALSVVVKRVSAARIAVAATENTVVARLVSIDATVSVASEDAVFDAVIVGLPTAEAPPIAAVVEMITHADEPAAVFKAVISAVIPTPSAVYSPAMSATIDGIKVGTTEIEIVSMGITGVDSEAPIAVVPIKGTVEIVGCTVVSVLPVKQNITQIEVATGPICAIKVAIVIDAHQIVEVDFVGSLILFVGEVQFIRHLIREEKGLSAGLFITHCICRDCQCEQRNEG